MCLTFCSQGKGIFFSEMQSNPAQPAGADPFPAHLEYHPTPFDRLVYPTHSYPRPSYPGADPDFLQSGAQARFCRHCAFGLALARTPIFATECPSLPPPSSPAIGTAVARGSKSMFELPSC